MVAGHHSFGSLFHKIVHFDLRHVESMDEHEMEYKQKKSSKWVHPRNSLLIDLTRSHILKLPIDYYILARVSVVVTLCNTIPRIPRRDSGCNHITQMNTCDGQDAMQSQDE